MSDNSFFSSLTNYSRNCETPQPLGFNKPWFRVSNICRDLSGSSLTLEDYAMRRKSEVLQYNSLQNNLTKKQRWAKISRGELGYKKSWAYQTFDYTNANSNNLPLVNNTLIYQNSNGECNESKIVKTLTTASNVPGKPMYLYLDPSVPLNTNRFSLSYSSAGSKLPQRAWEPGDVGFPVGKSGSNV